MKKLLVDYKFKNIKILESALMHPSFNKKTNNLSNNEYERLEFLGDNILSAIIADIIYNKYLYFSEGDLSVIHANAINTKSLSKVAKNINLNKFIIMDYGEEIIGGRNNPHNLENAMEALIGAIFIDSNNYNLVKTIIKKLWKNILNNPQIHKKNNKTILQEWMQKYYKTNPNYILENKEGNAHSPRFSISLEIPKIGKIIAKGKSKKEAEQKVASLMLKKIIK